MHDLQVPPPVLAAAKPAAVAVQQPPAPLYSSLKMHNTVAVKNELAQIRKRGGVLAVLKHSQKVLKQALGTMNKVKKVVGE